MKRRTLAVVAGVAILVTIGVLIQEYLLGFFDEMTFDIWVKYQGMFSDGVPPWVFYDTRYVLIGVAIALLTLAIMGVAAICKKKAEG
jgi:hypothetical protein